jgi:hypothetical protein
MQYKEPPEAVQSRPTRHAVLVNSVEFDRIRDGRRSVVIMNATLCREGDTVLIKDREDLKVMLAEVTGVEYHTSLNVNIVHVKSLSKKDEQHCGCLEVDRIDGTCV